MLVSDVGVVVVTRAGLYGLEVYGALPDGRVGHGHGRNRIIITKKKMKFTVASLIRSLDNGILINFYLIFNSNGNRFTSLVLAWAIWHRLAKLSILIYEGTIKKIPMSVTTMSR